jgi:hypothetical protein
MDTDLPQWFIPILIAAVLGFTTSLRLAYFLAPVVVFLFVLYSLSAWPYVAFPFLFIAVLTYFWRRDQQKNRRV